MPPASTSDSLLLLDDMLQPGNHEFWRERAKAESGTPGLQGWDDLREIVADQAKSSVLCEFLYHCKGNIKLKGNSAHFKTEIRL